MLCRQEAARAGRGRAVRRGAQESCRSARDDRRRHLADRRVIRDILHRLADRARVTSSSGRGGPGRGRSAQMGGGEGFDALQAGARERPDWSSWPRRRLYRGPVGVQRGGGREGGAASRSIISAGARDRTSLCDSQRRGARLRRRRRSWRAVRRDLLASCASSATHRALRNPDARASRGAISGRRPALAGTRRLLEPQRKKPTNWPTGARALGGRLDRGAASRPCRPARFVTLLTATHRHASERLQALWRVAELAHPNRPLARGYARVEDRDGRTLTSAAAAREAGRLKLVFSDDAVEASAGDPPRPRRPGLTKVGPDQPRLF